MVFDISTVKALMRKRFKSGLIWAVTLIWYLPPTAFSEETDKDPLRPIQESIVSFVLDNGLRVILAPSKQAPVFTGYIWVKVGGVNEVTGNTGLSHFLEHMAFKGTQTIGTRDYAREQRLLEELESLVSQMAPGANIHDNPDVQQIEAELEKIWIPDEFSSIYAERGQQGLNAFTSNDFTAYLVSLPKTAFELWCWMESDRLMEPVFRGFYKEREVIMEERRMRTEDDPGGLLYEAVIASAFWSHPNRLPDIGWPSDIKTLTETKMRAHWATYYRPDNVVLSIAGDIDPEVARPLIERYFSRWKSPATPLPQVVTEEMPQRGERDITVEYDAKPRFLLAYHVPSYPDPDNLALELLHEVLSGGRSSVLYRELVLEKRLATSVDTTDEPSVIYPSLLLIGATPAEGVSNRALRDEVEKILNRLKTTGFSEEDINGARRRNKKDYLLQLSSNSNLAFVLGAAELLYGDWREIFSRYQKVMALKSSDLQNFLSRYVVPRNRTYVHLEKETGK